MIRCPVCGHENPETSRFCGACAAPLAEEASPPEVRKTVTILFCDLVGSTAMVEALDPEKLRMVTRRYFDAMRAPIDRHGGTVEKFIGDAVMAVFGVPQVHEDDALRAVRAAGEMRQVLEDLNPLLDRDHGVTLACRIGVNTGEVVTGSGDVVVVGDAVNVAARLEQAAPPGEILLGELTHRLVRDAVVTEPVDAMDLKGKKEPVPAYRLIEVTPGAPGFTRRLDAPIVGRERELALLHDAFERTVNDQACQLFTVLGVAGVGKSRVMGAFVDELGDRATVLRGRCLPYGDGITFYPLVEAMTEAGDLKEGDPPGVARAKLAALVGEDDRAERVAELVGQAIGIPGSEAAPEELAWAVRTLLERLAAARPVAFVIDDLQWAEPRFLEVVEHVADFAGDAPILLACMARPELLDEHPSWGGGKLNATSILLEPLDPGACGNLVANLLAVTLDEVVRDRIVQAAGGHPLYAEEMTGLLVDEGRLVQRDGRWTAATDLAEVPIPPTISALLAARLDKLAPNERRLIDIASVMGQVFYPDAVGSLADDAPARVQAGLRGLLRQQFIKPERSDLLDVEALAFRHLLIRDSAYDGIPKADRAELHERFADWLVEVGGAIGEQDEIIGYHLERAYGLRVELGAKGDAERRLADRAGQRLAAAGERAYARGDTSAVTSLLSRASALLEPDDPLRLRVLPDLGAASFDAGELDAGKALITEAIERASAAGDEPARIHAALVQYWTRSGEEAVDEHLVEEALSVFTATGDERGLARAWRMNASVLFNGGRITEALRALDEALIHARNAGDIGEETEAFQQLGVIFSRGSVPIGEAVRRCREILAHHEGNRTIAAGMFHALAHLLARQGEFDEALDLAGRCRRIYRENGALWAYWFYTEIEWDVESLAGDHERALAILTEGYEQLDAMGDTFRLLDVFLAQSLCALGRFDDAEPRAMVAVGTADDQSRNAGLGVLARILARRGRFAEAEAMAREASTYFEATEFSIERTTLLLDLAEVLRLAGRSDEAVSTLRKALELLERREDTVSAAKTRALIAELV